jgi:hypothetical protein
LLGYELNSSTLRRGDTLRLTLYWQALDEMDESLTTFAHLLDAHGMIVPGAGHDKLPLDGARLTDSWVAGEFLTDTFSLPLPDTLPSGPYTIEVGWYDAADPHFPRLPATGQGADQDRVLLREQLE